MLYQLGLKNEKKGAIGIVGNTTAFSMLSAHLSKILLLPQRDVVYC